METVSAVDSFKRTVWTVDRNSELNTDNDMEETPTEELAECLFAEAASLWMAEKENTLAQTASSRYRFMLERYILPLIGGTRVIDITSAETEEMIRTVMGQNEGKGKRGGSLKGGSISMIRFIVRSVIAYASGEENTGEKVELVRSEKDEFLPLTEREVEQVCRCARFNHCPEMLGVLMMIFMGIRLGELCALSCDDIYLDKKEIYIHRSVHRIKREKERDAHKTENRITEISTKSQIRTERIPEELLDYVKEFYAPGTIMMTGKREIPMEARTLSNRVAKIFEVYRIENMPFQRFRKTYVERKAYTYYLAEK